MKKINRTLYYCNDISLQEAKKIFSKLPKKQIDSFNYFAIKTPIGSFIKPFKKEFVNDCIKILGKEQFFESLEKSFAKYYLSNVEFSKEQLSTQIVDSLMNNINSSGYYELLGEELINKTLFSFNVAKRE